MNAFVFGLALLAQSKPSEGKVGWVKDYDQALKAAAQSGQPLLIYFSCC